AEADLAARLGGLEAWPALEQCDDGRAEMERHDLIALPHFARRIIAARLRTCAPAIRHRRVARPVGIERRRDAAHVVCADGDHCGPAERSLHAADDALIAGE